MPCRLDPFHRARAVEHRDSRWLQAVVRTLQMKLTIFHAPPERISDTASVPQWVKVAPLRNV